MLHPMMPFALDGNLGRAYNEAMALVPDGEWVVFLDHDMMFTTREWFGQLSEAIAFKPDAGAFVACSNRIGAFWQQVGNAESHDVAEHRKFGTERLKVRTLLDVTDSMGFGGVCFAFAKNVWREIGGFAEGMFCVDHSFHFRARAKGYRIYLLESLYVYHWRRAEIQLGAEYGARLPATLKYVDGCPCRGPERRPSQRIALP
jgi:GT2 family glycosyltransferase